MSQWHDVFDNNDNHADLRVAYVALRTAVRKLCDGHPLLERT
eukprot:COSAG02_NODE_4073_length_5830_cov_3.915373_7_plen_42_part_00